METILQIRVSHDGRRMVAWEPFAEADVAAVEIRPAEPGDGYADGEDPSAVADALRELTQAVIDEYHWLHGE